MPPHVCHRVYSFDALRSPSAGPSPRQSAGRLLGGVRRTSVSVQSLARGCEPEELAHQVVTLKAQLTQAQEEKVRAGGQDGMGLERSQRQRLMSCVFFAWRKLMPISPQL